MMARKWVKSEEKSRFQHDFDVTLSAFYPLGPLNRFGKVTSMAAEYKLDPFY